MTVEIRRVIQGGPQGPAVEFGERGTLETSQSAHEIYQVSEGRKAKLATLIMTNLNQSQTADFGIYDATSTVSNRVLELMIAPYGTQVLGPADLIGVKEPISSFVVRCSVSGNFIHLGGFESPG